jgi:hypothetical protein
MKHLLALALLAATLGLPPEAHADGLRLGGQLLFSPDGTVAYDVPGTDPYAYSLGRSYGASALVGYDLSPYVTVGIAPSALFGVKRDSLENDEAVTELDVAVRAIGRLPLTRGGLELQLHVAPGYSWIVGDLSQTYGFHETRGRLFLPEGEVETDFEYELDTIRLGVGVHATL